MRRLPATAGARFGRGLLWRLDSAGATASYLFGTMHSADPRIASPADAVIGALAGCRHLILEVKLDTAKQMQRHFQAPGDTDLEQLLQPSQWRRLTAVLQARGMSAQRARSMPPWAVALSLQTPESGGAEPLDLALQHHAEALGKPVLALESVAEQLAVFTGLGLDEQRRLLLSTLCQLEEFPDLLERMTGAYLARDLRQLSALLADQMAVGDPQYNATFMARLLDDRNRRMLGRMLPRLRRGGSLVAVGALHLTGERGLLTRLAGQGFSISCAY